MERHYKQLLRDVNYCLWTLHTIVYKVRRMSLGENVRYLREARGFTYDAVGTAVGTDGQNIYALEKRKSKMSKFAPALADFFQVDLTALTSSDLTSMSIDEIRHAHGKRRLAAVESKSEDPPEVFEMANDMIEIYALFRDSTRAGRQTIKMSARLAEKIPGSASATRDDAQHGPAGT